mmetsp:Transcript_79882/g.202008  ORF Transcript_79882/g.202008 Transcript_79882/m.202008 type:complete len:367 (+) Transcript_79882:758-1858(+)
MDEQPLHLAPLVCGAGRREGQAGQVPREAQADGEYPRAAARVYRACLQAARVECPRLLRAERTLEEGLERRVEDSSKRLVALSVPGDQPDGSAAIDVVHGSLDREREWDAASRAPAPQRRVDLGVPLQHPRRQTPVAREVRQRFGAILQRETRERRFSQARHDQAATTRHAQQRPLLELHGDEVLAARRDTRQEVRLGHAKHRALRQLPLLPVASASIEVKSFADPLEVWALAELWQPHPHADLHSRPQGGGARRDETELVAAHEAVALLLERRQQGGVRIAEAREGRREVRARVAHREADVVLVVHESDELPACSQEGTTSVRPVPADARGELHRRGGLGEKGVCRRKHGGVLLGHALRFRCEAC